MKKLTILFLLAFALSVTALVFGMNTITGDWESDWMYAHKAISWVLTIVPIIATVFIFWYIANRMKNPDK